MPQTMGGVSFVPRVDAWNTGESNHRGLNGHSKGGLRGEHTVLFTLRHDGSARVPVAMLELNKRMHICERGGHKTAEI